MQKYGNFRPTGFDSEGKYMLPDRAEWLMVPVSRTRDSGLLAQSNFDAALEWLGGESDTIEVHRFGHWGPGWFEIVLIDPADSKAVAEGEAIEAALEDYPILNESAYSQATWEATYQAWAQMRMSDRIYECHRARIPIFAARRDSAIGEYDRLYETVETHWVEA